MASLNEIFFYLSSEEKYQEGTYEEAFHSERCTKIHDAG